MKKFGCENPSQNDQIKQKKINTCLKNNGYEYIFQSEKFKQNIKEYNLKKFGCENPSQNDQIKQKKINTCLKNNGCEYPQQNSKIHKKQLQSSFKIKSYKELYNITKEKENWIKQSGYNLITMWEYDYNRKLNSSKLHIIKRS